MARLDRPIDSLRAPLAPDLRSLSERGRRAWTERMAVRPLGGGRYAVDSESDATYVVDLGERSCTCPDYRIRGRRCKHLRRVAIEITAGHVPPPGAESAPCRVCGEATAVSRPPDAPPVCARCRLTPGDVVRDRETGDRLVVVGVPGTTAEEYRIESADATVAEYPTNRGYPADDPVIEAVYVESAVETADPRRYAFPRSRLRRPDDAGPE